MAKNFLTQKPEAEYPETHRINKLRLEQNDVAFVETEEKRGDEIKKTKYVDVLGIRVETYIENSEDLESILEESNPRPKTLEIMQHLAVNHALGRGLIVEGDPDIGKTEAVNIFTKLVFGKNAKPVDFYCNGQTDVSQLMSKWVPKTGNDQDTEKWEHYIAKTGTSRFKDIIQKVNKSKKTEEDIEQSVEDMMLDIVREAGITNSVSQWDIQLGSLPKAMSMPVDPSKSVSEENPARGAFLHIQEIGLAESQVVNALLEMGGRGGKLADHVTLWDDNGREVPAGPDFNIFMTTNPKETHPDRNLIDLALMRRFGFLTYFAGRKGDNESKQLNSTLGLIETAAAYLKDKKLLDLDLVSPSQSKELKEKRNELVSPFENMGRKNLDKGNSWLSREINAPVVVEVVKILNEFALDVITSHSQDAIQKNRDQKVILSSYDISLVFQTLPLIMGKKLNAEVLESALDKAIEIHFASKFSLEPNTKNAGNMSGREKVMDIWETQKTTKKFLEKIKDIVPKEQSEEDMEKMSELLKTLKELKDGLADLEKQAQDVCEIEGKMAEAATASAGKQK